MTTTKDLLQKYIDLDNEIKALESKNTTMLQRDDQEEMATLDQRIAQLQQAHDAAKKITYALNLDVCKLSTQWV